MKNYLYKNKGLLFLNILFTVLSVIFVSIIPLTTKYIIENYNELNSNKVFFIALIYVGSVILFLLFEYLKKIMMGKIQRRVNTQFKNDIFYQLLCSEHYQISLYSSSDYVNLLTHDIDTIYQKYFGCIIDVYISVISFICYAGIMFFLDWKLAICIILSCFLSLLIPKLVGKDLANKEQIASLNESSFINVISVLIEGKSMFSKDSSSSLMNEYKKSNEKLENSVYELNKSISISNIFSGFSLYFINIVSFIVGVLFIYLKWSTLSSFIAIIAYIELLAIPTRDIIYEIITLKSTKEIRKKFNDVFKLEPQKSLSKISFDEIRIENLSFAYEEKDILSNINVKIEKNKKYAVIGKNGSGKSTLIKILSKELSSYTGSIMVGEKNLYDIPFSSFGFYAQAETIILDGTLSDNITLFDAYPLSIENEIGRMGLSHLSGRELCNDEDNLSSGEKAKISILRALNSQKEVLIFDEIFANVDQKSEIELTKYLLSLDKTIILITHNLDEDNLNRFDSIIRL